MIKIVVGSKNPVKISAAQTAIRDALSLKEVECIGINAPSSVAEQPMTSEETKLGAVNRIQYCQQHTRADFYVAIEGGVDQFEYGPATFAFVAIANQKMYRLGAAVICLCHPSFTKPLKAVKNLVMLWTDYLILTTSNKSKVLLAF